MNQDPRIELFGPPKLYVDGEHVRISARQAALLSLFVLRGTDRIDRGQAASMLWSGVTATTARHSLSQALYALKKHANGRILIGGDYSELRLRNITSDIVDFGEAIKNTAWPTAAQLFQGPLLDGLEIPNAEEFNSWLDALRTYYLVLASDVLTGLRLDGSTNAAATLASRLPPEFVAPTPEAMLGASHTALAVDPSDQNDSEASLVDLRSDVAPFVGRRLEMDQLETLFGRSERVGFTCVVIEGEPGIGKSALAERFARLRAIRGSRVLTAKGFLAERNVPFGVVAQWLRSVEPSQLRHVDEVWLDIVNEAFPNANNGRRQRANSGTGDPSGSYRLVEALRQAFVTLTKELSLLLVLDDAHLADAASLSFLHYYARRSASTPVVVLATVRNPSLWGADPFAQWEHVERLSIGPLPVEDTATLVARYEERASRPFNMPLAELSRRTGGNPLLLVSMLSSSVSPAKTEIPDSVTNFFIPRLDALSRDGLVLLAAISFCGTTPDIELISNIAGMRDESARLIRALTELEDAALVIGEGEDSLRPRHSIVGEIAVSRLSAPDRKALHGRAARIMSDEGRSPPAVLAIHHDIAGDKTRAFETAVSAASASRELHASREQEFFLKLALSNAPDAAAAVEMRLQLSALFRSMGRLRDGLEIISEVSTASAPAIVRRRAHATRLAIRMLMGDTTSSSNQLSREIEGLAQVVEPDVMAELYLDVASSAHDAGERSAAMGAANKASALVRNLPPTLKSGLLAIRSAMVSGLYVNVDEGLESVERTLPIAQSSVEALCLWMPVKGTLLVAAGRLMEAERIFLEAIELLERYCLFGTLFSLHNNLGVCYTDQGRYGDALLQFEEAARLGREFSVTGEASTVADNLAMLHLERGEHDLALRTVRGAMTKATSRSPRELFHRHALIGLCSLELGLLAQAFEAKREIDLLFQQHEYWGSDVSYVETFLARMLVMEGRPEAARARLETAVEIYQPRDVMCRARLELELVRLDLKTDPAGALERAESMLETLRGTGARPLVDRFEELADRARRHAD
jgi:tetratricopeptide (TPR) repeat protein